MKYTAMMILVSITALFAGQAIAEGDVVKTFSGSGGKNTRPFTVQSGWEIQWDAKGDLFQIYLHTSNGDMVGVPANQQGAGAGSSYQPEGGQYYLQVNAIGDWSIKIVNLE